MSSKYPRKERTIAWKKKVKSPHQRSPYATNFADRSHEETERQERCARGKAWNLAKHIYKLKEKDKATFYSPTDEWIMPAACTNKSGGKRVCGRFRSKFAYGQQERPQLCRVGDHEDIEESDDGDDGQRRAANKRRSHGFLTKNWTYS